jgi:TusA-related sulfurtransferase
MKICSAAREGRAITKMAHARSRTGRTEHSVRAMRTRGMMRCAATATSGVASDDGISIIILVAATTCQCQNFQKVMGLVADRSLDCVGLFCPIPVLKTREVMKSMGVGEVLEMLSDDPGSEADITAWAARTGNELLQIDRDGAIFRFVVRKSR